MQACWEVPSPLPFPEECSSSVSSLSKYGAHVEWREGAKAAPAWPAGSPINPRSMGNTSEPDRVRTGPVRVPLILLAMAHQGLY